MAEGGLSLGSQFTITAKLQKRQDVNIQFSSYHQSEMNKRSLLLNRARIFPFYKHLANVVIKET